MTANSHDTPSDAPLVIAHRTAMGHAPENTLLGVRRALELRADGVEIDVQLSADGAVALLHDPPPRPATLAELRERDLGEGQRVPTLGETLAAVDGRALLVVELKVPPEGDAEALAEAVLAEIAAAEAMPWCWLWSFDVGALRALARRSEANARIAHLCLTPTPEVYQLCAELGLQGVSMHYTACTREQVEACGAHGLASFVWTVNEKSEIERLTALNPTGIVGDYPERIRAGL